MSDACLLCDHNVPMSAPHFVVNKTPGRSPRRGKEEAYISEETGSLCGDAQACLQRAVLRSRQHETFRSEHQIALKDAISRIDSFGELLPG